MALIFYSFTKNLVNTSGMHDMSLVLKNLLVSGTQFNKDSYFKDSKTVKLE